MALRVKGGLTHDTADTDRSDLVSWGAAPQTAREKKPSQYSPEPLLRMRPSAAPRARPFADARGACAAFTQPIALHLACESHAGCMKRAIALAVAEENASLVVSATAEHARTGPDHCRRFWVPPKEWS